jgi:hypothetical protein
LDNRISTRRTKTAEVVREEISSHPVNYTTAYLRRLIAERAYIRAALYNHGGSIITRGVSLDLEGQDQYTSQIGNDYHLDLVSAEDIIAHDMPKEQRDTLMQWADGVDEKTANELARSTSAPKSRVVHMRRKRALERLTEQMQDGEQLGGGSGESSEGVRESEG